MATSMNNFIFTATLAFCGAAFANGPDQWELFGMSKQGQKVSLSYGGYELEQKNKGIAIYVDKSRPAYGFCVPGASPTEGEYFLYCSQSLGGEPDPIKKKDANLQSTAYLQEAKRLYKRQFKVNDRFRIFSGYYRCIKGCDKPISEAFTEINAGD